MKILTLVLFIIFGVTPALTQGFQTGQSLQLGLGTTSNVTFSSLTVGGALTYPTSAVPRIYGSANSSGTTSGSDLVAYYLLNTNSDSVDCSSVGGCYNFYTGLGYGGATVKGNRTGMFSFMNLTAPTGNTGTGAYYTALGSESRASANDNGTAPAPRGGVFGFNTIARLASGATFYEGLSGAEHDVASEAGSSVAYKTGMSVVQLATDANRGSVFDVALLIANQYGGTAPGWLRGLTFGGPLGWWPFASTATMIGTAAGFAGGPAYQAAYGVDFSAVTFSTGFLKSTGFLVDGSGNITAAALGIGATNTTAGTLVLSNNTAYGGTMKFGNTPGVVLRGGDGGSDLNINEAGYTTLVLNAGASIVANAPIVTPGYTIAALPAGTVGMRAHVTNQLTTCAAIGAALTAGGSVVCPVFYNGTAWVGG